MSSESISELWIESNRKVVHIIDPSKSSSPPPRFFPQGGTPYPKSAVDAGYTPNGDYAIGGGLINDTASPSIFLELGDMRVVNNPNTSNRTRFSARVRNGEVKEEKKSSACRYFIFIIIIVIFVYFYFFYKK